MNVTCLKLEPALGNATGLSTVTTSQPITGIIGIGSDIRLDNLQFSCPGGSGVTTSIFPDGTQGYTYSVTNVKASDKFELYEFY